MEIDGDGISQTRGQRRIHGTFQVDLGDVVTNGEDDGKRRGHFGFARETVGFQFVTR